MYVRMNVRIAFSMASRCKRSQFRVTKTIELKLTVRGLATVMRVTAYLRVQKLAELSNLIVSQPLTPVLLLFQEKISVTRDQFERSVKELNHYVKPVGVQAITYEYTDYMAENDSHVMLDALDKMVGDYHFTCPTITFADRYAETFNNVFQYFYDHRASNHAWPRWTGVLHGDEVSFIFGEPLNPKLGFTEKEKKFSRELMTYWSNFAKTG